MISILNNDERKTMNELIDLFMNQYLSDISYDEDGNPIFYDDGDFEKFHFNNIQSICRKLEIS